VCGPSARTCVVYGELQAEGCSLSTAHSNVASGSVDENVNVGVRSLVGVGSSGPDWKVVGGPLTTWANAGAASATPAVRAAANAAVLDHPWQVIGIPPDRAVPRSGAD
jgi:hypothetical protein